MNVKKMFASLTGVLMLATTVSPLVTGAATYSDELQGAYDYAYSKGITTMTSIDNANMYWNLTRGQLSKMISQWAEKEMGVKVDETAVCSFSDTNTAEGDLATYVVKACQMGLMGQGIEKFRPNDQVSRGEFGTVLSRAIWGDKYDGATPFYTKHLQALQEAGIMNNISEPNNAEVRGWVMLMLERASETVNPSECDDPAVLFACALDAEGENCPAACREGAKEDVAEGSTIDGMAIAGDLSISVADYSESVKSAPAVGTVVFNAVDFKASEKVTIESVKLERTGLSSKSDIKGVWFEKDGVAVSAKASVTSDGTVTTRFYNGYSVSSSETLDLVVELSGAAGSEIAFNLVSATSTAKNATVKGSTTTYRTTNYTVSEIKFDAVESAAIAPAADVTYKLGEKESYEIGRFYISNETKGEDKDVVIKSIKLKNNEKVDLATTLKNVQIYRDNKVVSKSVELASKDMTIYFNDEVLANGKRGSYSIMAEVAQLENVGDRIQLYLNKNTELVGNEKSTNFRATATVDDTEMKIYQFDGGKLTLAWDSNFPKTVEAAQGSTDVQLAKGTFTVSEPIKLEGFSITATSTVDDLDNIIKDLKLEIGGSTYSTTYTKTNANNGTFKIDDEIYVSKTSDIAVLANVYSSALEGSTVTFGSNLKWGLFTKVTFENTDETKTGVTDYVAGSVNIAKLSVKTPSFSITNKASGNARVVKSSSDSVVIFDGEVSTNKDDLSVTLLNLEYAAWTDIQADEQIDVTIYVNGDEYVSTATYKAGKVVSFNNIGDVKKWTPMKLKIEVTPSVDTPTSLTFKINAEGSDSQSNKVAATDVRTLKLEVVDNAEVTIANSTATSTVEIASSNTEILKFSADVENGSTTLSAIYVTWTFNALDTTDNVTAKLSNGSTLSNWVVNNAKDTITFAWLNETINEGTLEVTLTANVDGDADVTAETADVATAKTALEAAALADLTPATALPAAVADAIDALANETNSANIASDKTDVSDAVQTAKGSAPAAAVTTAIDDLGDAVDDLITKNASEHAGKTITVTSIELDYDGNKATKDGLSIAKYFTKARPTLSLVKNDDNELVVKITNPSDSAKSFTIVGYTKSGTVTSASLNWQTIGNDGSIAAGKQVTLSKWTSTELRLGTSAGVVKLTGITIEVEDKWTYTYAITESYTNVATWWDLKVNYKS